DRIFLFELLEIAIGAPLLHRGDAAHAAIALVRTPLIELDLTRRLVGTGEEAAEHDRVRARSDGLGNVAGVADPAVGDRRNAGLVGAFERRLDCRDLRHPHAGDDARRADRARTDADLDAVGGG